MAPKRLQHIFFNQKCGRYYTPKEGILLLAIQRSVILNSLGINKLALNRHLKFCEMVKPVIKNRGFKIVNLEIIET